MIDISDSVAKVLVVWSQPDNIMTPVHAGGIISHPANLELKNTKYVSPCIQSRICVNLYLKQNRICVTLYQKQNMCQCVTLY